MLPATERSVGDVVGSAAVDIDALKFSRGKESNGAGIGGPKGVAGTLGAGENFAFGGLQRAQPKADFAIGFMNGRDDVAAVGRNRGDAAFVGFDGSELGFFGRKQSGAKRGAIRGVVGAAREFWTEDKRDGNDGGGFDEVRKIFSEFGFGFGSDGASGIGAVGGGGEPF